MMEDIIEEELDEDEQGEVGRQQRLQRQRRFHHVPLARQNSRVQFVMEMLRNRRQEAIIEAIKQPDKNRSASERFDLLSHNCLSDFGDNTSMHGPKWYNLKPNYFCRVLLAMFIVIFLISFPIIFYNALHSAFTSNSVTTTIEIQKAVDMMYPNLTVCFAKFFDKQRLDDEGISNHLANYMTMAIDPNAGKIVQFMKREIANYSEMLISLETELQNKLQSSGLTLPDLFHKVAVSCDDFIQFCEIHQTYYFASNSNETCCGTIFNTTPFFSPTGTCFTTQKEVIENLPFAFSSIKVWLNLHNDNATEFDLIFKGSDATESTGAFYTISALDHPITKLLQAPKKISSRTSALLGVNFTSMFSVNFYSHTFNFYLIKSNEKSCGPHFEFMPNSCLCQVPKAITMDRTSLRSGFCRSNVEMFEKQYHIPYTEVNCEFFVNTGFQHDCSFTQYYGLKWENSKRPCLPTDFLNSSSYFDNNTFTNLVGGENTVCLQTCLRTEHKMTVTEGKIDIDAAAHLLNFTESIGNPRDLAFIQMHFNSFNFDYYTLSQPGFEDILSKFGGWLGVAIGASVISFVEMSGYVLCFILKFVKRKVDWE